MALEERAALQRLVREQPPQHEQRRRERVALEKAV
jgi:hypothetical protein